MLDFTTPYFLEYVTLVSRAPALKNRTFAVFSPFSLQVRPGANSGICKIANHTLLLYDNINIFIIHQQEVLYVIQYLFFQVWLCVALITVMMGPVASVLVRVRASYEGEPQRCSTHDYTFSAFRNLVVQGNRIPVVYLPSRFIFIFWYLFCFYVYGRLSKFGVGELQNRVSFYINVSRSFL